MNKSTYSTLSMHLSASANIKNAAFFGMNKSMWS